MFNEQSVTSTDQKTLIVLFSIKTARKHSLFTFNYCNG